MIRISLIKNSENNSCWAENRAPKGGTQNVQTKETKYKNTRKNHRGHISIYIKKKKKKKKTRPNLANWVHQVGKTQVGVIHILYIANNKLILPKEWIINMVPCIKKIVYFITFSIYLGVD